MQPYCVTCVTLQPGWTILATWWVGVWNHLSFGSCFYEIIMDKQTIAAMWKLAFSWIIRNSSAKLATIPDLCCSKDRKRVYCGWTLIGSMGWQVSTCSELLNTFDSLRHRTSLWWQSASSHLGVWWSQVSGVIYSVARVLGPVQTHSEIHRQELNSGKVIRYPAYSHHISHTHKLKLTAAQNKGLV